MKKSCLRLLCVALCMVLVMGCLSGVAQADAFKDYIHGSNIGDNGFVVPYPDAGGFNTKYYQNDYMFLSTFRGLDDQVLGMIAAVYPIGTSFYNAMYEDSQKAIDFYKEECRMTEDYKSITSNFHGLISNVHEDIIEIEGHPAYICRYKSEKRGWTGDIFYIRNSAYVNVVLTSKKEEITEDDMLHIASLMSYEEETAPFVAADTLLSVSSKGDPVTVTAGKNVAFTAAFANPSRVNQKNKNDAVVWSVGKADTGDAVEGVTIDAKGQLKVDKNLAAPVDLQVKVASELFGTSATYNISALPVVSTR
ncbi:hypothetical protein JS518_14170 [Clostridiales bacterium FE2010]|nr:hypothetical protein JS518_14170 [Clostridiales bacterium FE2010]